MLQRAFGGKATTDERTDELGRHNHGIGISYDIKVALLVNERGEPYVGYRGNQSCFAEKRSVRPLDG